MTTMRAAWPVIMTGLLTRSIVGRPSTALSNFHADNNIMSHKVVIGRHEVIRSREPGGCQTGAHFTPVRDLSLVRLPLLRVSKALCSRGGQDYYGPAFPSFSATYISEYMWPIEVEQ